MGNLVEPIFIKDFFPKQILDLTYSYCVIKYSNLKKFDLDTQTNSLISEHGDYFMETLLASSTPVIEQNVGKKLFPTYSFLEFTIRALLYQYTQIEVLVNTPWQFV